MRSSLMNSLPRNDPMKLLKTSAIAVIILSTMTLVACKPAGSTTTTPEMSAKQNINETFEINQRVRLLDDEKSKHVIVIAHRSCWQNAPENSLLAVKKCIDLNVDMIEVDVRLTKDKKLVVMHDETLERTTTGTGLVSEHTLAEIQALKLKNRDGTNEAVTNEHPPSLEELLLAAKGKLLINLDLKESLFEQAYTIVNELGMSEAILMKMNADPVSPKLTGASFVGRVNFMPILHECDPFYEKSFCSKTLAPIVDDYRTYKPIAYEIVFSNDEFLSEGVPSIETEGSRVWVNTMFYKHSAGRLGEDGIVDPDKVWGSLVRMGANMIQTDYPEDVIKYLSTIDRRVELNRAE